MYLPYVLKELARRKLRTGTNVLTIAVVTSMLILTSTLMAAYSTAIYLPFENVDSDLILEKSANTTADRLLDVRVPFGKGIFDESEVERIAELDHVAGISRTLVLWDFGRKGFVSIEGLDPDELLGGRLGSWITGGRFINGSDNGEVVLEGHFARFHHLKPGDSMTIGGRSFTVVGVLKVKQGSQVSSANVYMGLSDARTLADTDGCSRLYIKLDDLSHERSVRREIGQISGNIVVLSGSSISATLGNMLEIYRRFYLLGLGVVTVVAILILSKTNASGLLERRRDMGVMQAVGWTKRDMRVQVVSEIFLQSLSGFLIGAVFSTVLLALASPISFEVPQIGLSSKPSEITVPLHISPQGIVGYFFLIISISIILSYFTARNISTKTPSENLRSL